MDELIERLSKALGMEIEKDRDLSVYSSRCHCKVRSPNGQILLNLYFNKDYDQGWMLESVGTDADAMKGLVRSIK